MKRKKLHEQGCASRVIELRKVESLYLESNAGDRVALGLHLEGEVAPAQPSCVLVAMTRKQLRGMRDYLTGIIDQVENDGSLA